MWDNEESDNGKQAESNTHNTQRVTAFAVVCGVDGFEPADEPEDTPDVSDACEDECCAVSEWVWRVCHFTLVEEVHSGEGSGDEQQCCEVNSCDGDLNDTKHE